MTKIFLGNPPEHIKNWILNHSKHDDNPGYLCFTAEEPNSSVGLNTDGNPPLATFQTSTDGNTWNDYQIGSTIDLPNIGDKVYFKAKSSNEKLGSDKGDHEFFMTGKIAASGNVNTLLTEDLAEAKTMSLEGRDYCFQYLFYNCTSLTKAPELPADTLADNCYANMFYFCTSLTQAPELLADTLADNCYYSMFYGCKSLTQAPVLPAIFLVSGCYTEMFYFCTSLTKAPELPADTLADNCYAEMFYGCSSLNSIKVGFNTWYATATRSWLPNNTGTFYCPQELIDNITDRTTSTVPKSWTMVAIA